LEIEAYPLLDELTSKISTLNLERVRRLKSRLVALTRRVQKVNYILILSMRCISDSWF
jgi:magnesium transporter